MRAVLILCLLVLAGGARAEGRSVLSDDQAVAYRGVGRLNIYGSRFCTAVMISDRLVLTAAHCVFSPIKKRLVNLDGLKFVAGQLRDTQVAARDVARMVVAEGFVYDPKAELKEVAADMALLELVEPIPAEAAEPFAVGGMGDGAGLRIVSYSKDRPFTPSQDGPCAVVAEAGGVATLACGVNSGQSGAPVLATRNGETRVVAVVSSMARDFTGRDLALVVPVAPRIVALKAALAQQKSVVPTP